MTRLLPLLLALMLAASLHAASPLQPSPVPDGLGVNIHFTDAKPGELEMIAAAGFRWVRMDLTWAATERERGQYDFAPYDRLLDSLDRFGMHALLILVYDNRLYERERSVRTEEGRAAYARWAAAAVARFAGRGVVWEIWNEPNGGFWSPRANVQEYAAMALRACKAMRAAGPRETIVGPATSRIDLPFIEGCCQAGLLEYWDAVSVHPYRQDGPEKTAGEYRTLRRLLAKYAKPGRIVPIISGEWGYSSAWKSFDAEKQGRMLPREFLVNLANGIPLSIWYDWHEDGPDPKEEEHHFGTVGYAYHAGADPVYEPKPAYLAAKTLMHALAGFSFDRRLGVGGSDDYVLLFRKGEELALALWTTATAPHVLRLGADPGSYRVTSMLGEQSEPRRIESGELQIEASQAPQYVTLAANANLAGAPAATLIGASLEPANDALRVRVENPLETAFAGAVSLTGTDGVQIPSLEQPVKFAAGEYKKTVSFALERPLGQTFQAGVQLKGPATSVALPARRFTLVPDDLWAKAKVRAEGNAKVSSELNLSPADAPAGPRLGTVTMRLSYRFGAGWKYVQVDPAGGAPPIIPGEPHRFGLWVYGDAKGGSPRLRVTDAAGQTWQPDGPLVEWTGWRFVEYTLSPARITGVAGMTACSITRFAGPLSSYWIILRVRNFQAKSI